MSEPKVFGYILFVPAAVRDALGMERHHQQVNAVVLARSQRAAADALGITVGELRRMGGETGNAEDIEAAVAAGEGVVLVRPLDRHRVPLVPLSSLARQT